VRRTRGLFRLILALVAVLIAAGGAVTLLAPAPDATVVAAGTVDRGAAWSILVAAAALVSAGLVAWAARPGSGLALIAFWAAAAWLAGDLQGSDTVTREVRALALVLAPMLAPLVVHLPVRAVRADRAWTRAVIVALYLAAFGLAIGHALTWDPYLVLDCAPTCGRNENPVAWFVAIPVSFAFRSAGWWLGGVAGAGLAFWAGRRMPRSPEPAERWVLMAALVAGIAITGWSATLVVAASPSSASPWSVRATVLLAVAIVGLGTSVSWMRLREGRRAAGLRRLVELLDGGAGSHTLAETLAAILHDPTVRVAYPMSSGAGVVDDQGRELAAPRPARGRAVTSIKRGGTVIALVEHEFDLDPDLITREIGAAAQLAVDNERLSALLRAQVRELQASRERIVAAGDAARGRLERDLHDGAQQRLLAVSYELRLARAAAAGETIERRAALDAAVDEIDRALGELRDLAHGIWPAVLVEAGLEAALGSLADEAAIPVTLEAVPEQRFPARTEAAAYLAVAEALRRATAGGATGLAVRAQQVGDRLVLEARAAGRLPPGPWLRVDDRVGAAGGRSVVSVDLTTGTLLTVELPCA